MYNVSKMVIFYFVRGSMLPHPVGGPYGMIPFPTEKERMSWTY